jgi:spermidine synthase
MTNGSLPYWPVNPTLTINLWYNFHMDVFRCALAIGPAAILWGASFPLALAAAAAPLVGGIYAANTIGAVIGVAAFSLVFVAGYGTLRAQQALVLISTLAAVIMLMSAGRAGSHKLDSRSLIAAALSVILAVAIVFSVPDLPTALVAYGRFLPNVLYNFRQDSPQVLYSGEGMNSSVAVTQLTNGVMNFHVSGKIEASTAIRDMKMQRMLGHLPALYHPAPRTVLIVGFGAGVTAGVFALYLSVERIVICEIEPLIPQVVANYFKDQNYNILNDPRVEVVYDDARNFIRTTHEKFDVISYDSIHPWVKGAATLYTDEYFNLARQHLNPGGTISLWVPLYECTMEAAKSQIATFLKTFPNGTLWSNSLDGGGYDLVMMAKTGDPSIDVGAFYDRLNRPDHLNVKYSLQGVGINSGLDLLATYAGRERELAPWLADAQINLDRNLKLQYLAGLGLNVYEQTAIFEAILSYSTFPDDLFIGRDDMKQTLKNALVQAGVQDRRP